MRFFSWALLIILCLSRCVFGQDTLRHKKVRITPLPALFYTPETRLGFGALLSGVFNTGDGPETRNSNVQVLGAYTLNNQVIAQIKHAVFTPNETYNLNGELSFYDFPILYYGIGNDTRKEFEEDLEYKVLVFRERVVRKVKDNWFVGLQYRYTYLYDLNYEPEFLLADTSRLQSETGRNSGLGIALLHDSRDNVLNATKGAFFQLSSFFHGSLIGSEYAYERYTIDARKFWTLTDKSVLAAQFFSELNTGGVPFREMSLLGGESIMRGYYNGRYRDNQQLAIQAEYRRQLIPWLGVAAFSAWGDVAPRLSAFDISDFKYTVGGGLRLMVNKTDRVNIRIDYGVGKNTSGFYFAFAEAF